MMNADAIRAMAKQRQRDDRWLKVLLLVMLAGYGFFFLSRFFFPKIYKNVEVTPIGAVLELGDYTLTLDAWDYAPKQRAFEILFDMENVSLDREPQLTFTCRSGEDIYPATLYRVTDDMLVLRVRHVGSRWTQASLTVKTQDKSERIMADDRSVTVVETLADRTDKEYTVYAAQNKLRACQEELADIARQKETTKADIEYSYEQLTRLIEKKASQTAEELEQTEKGIRTLADTQARLENEMDDLARRETALMEKVEVLEARLRELGGDVP